MLFAKSDSKESIYEHTQLLLKNLEQLEETYANRLKENQKIAWETIRKLLRIAAQYHDAGKVYTSFQNQIRKKLKLDLLPTNLPTSIGHEELSPLLVPFSELGLTKEEEKIVKFAIYFHHERRRKDITRDDFVDIIRKIIEEDFNPRIEEIKAELQLSCNTKMKASQLAFLNYGISNSEKEKQTFLTYCMVKGLLHKLDYSASAHTLIEKRSEISVEKQVEKVMAEKKQTKNELQIFCQNHQQENLVLIGSTGIGKTEAALLWSGDSKLFFTLPYRVSINAIYDRIKNDIGYEMDCLGLLHSTAFDYLQEKEELDTTYDIFDKSQLFAMHITTSTIDQLFPFVFMYKGFELIYSILSYSKIVIDEIQAYSPHIVATVIKGLEMIHEIGGKFLVMTATLPGIYKEELEKRQIAFQSGTFLKKNELGESVKRHRITLLEKSILEDIDIMLEKAEKDKVLVIANTVGQAMQLYEKCKHKIEERENVVKCRLLHSRFIQKDRSQLEEEIKEFSDDQTEIGIWITTQVVEASLDIDFDYLFTEISTLDSLFQRMGRCYRKRELENEKINIWIYTKDSSGVSSSKNAIYDSELVEKSLQKLKAFDKQILEEEKKVEMVEKLYSKEELEGSKFMKEFTTSIEVLDKIVLREIEKEKAQRILRNIQSQTVMPDIFYEEMLEKIEEIAKEMAKEKKDFRKSAQLKREIVKFTTNISNGQFNKIKQEGQVVKQVKEIPEIWVVTCKYDTEKGLLLEKDIEYDTESRFF